MPRLASSLKSSAALLALGAWVGITACTGCQQAQPPAATAAGPGLPSGDPLAEMLALAEAGDTEAAIEQFVHKPPANWIESTSLEEFQRSEAEFQALGHAEKSRLQAQFIDRVEDIKGFARIVVDRASEAEQQGETKTAQEYLEAVNRLGRQLRDADVVLVFQQTGQALANATLED